MNRRTFIILVIVFAVLVMIALQQSNPFAVQTMQATVDPVVTPTTNAAEFLSGYQLISQRWGVTIDDIVAIRLRDPETTQTFAISRDPGGNWIAPESDGTLDATAAENIAKTVVLLPYERTLEVTADTALSDYGFIPDGIFSIEILLQDNQTHAVVIGGFTPTQQSYYGLVDGKEEIYLFERRAIDFLLIQLKTPPVS
ncbi:MAG: DUF4340 domain-containing protein [Chloroflexi bacterium]|nr:DUF4340 domain-containing protein [Chloroflexota bacterium]MCC6895637.1 DUF4340 domain-containing protein [Anaerolineae bacterium]